ncbi:hypothetical protein JRQ81_002698 [Phrynocephalus forsythii]|uniref:Secreted protein n=1 Tax=Phrynocephalus forsythii TaxID=171643 RepID=A0A9Q0XJ44_9SAUR|nr:hypothetical protein JRQ81_002698 [Phrynocephalus forsythii]
MVQARWCSQMQRLEVFSKFWMLVFMHLKIFMSSAEEICMSNHNRKCYIEKSSNQRDIKRTTSMNTGGGQPFFSVACLFNVHYMSVHCTTRHPTDYLAQAYPCALVLISPVDCACGTFQQLQVVGGSFAIPIHPCS